MPSPLATATLRSPSLSEVSTATGFEAGRLVPARTTATTRAFQTFSDVLREPARVDEDRDCSPAMDRRRGRGRRSHSRRHREVDRRPRAFESLRGVGHGRRCRRADAGEGRHESALLQQHAAHRRSRRRTEHGQPRSVNVAAGLVGYRSRIFRDNNSIGPVSRPGVHLHDRDAGLGVAGLDGALDRRGSAPARQQARVDVQATARRRSLKRTAAGSARMPRRPSRHAVSIRATHRAWLGRLRRIGRRSGGPERLRDHGYAVPRPRARLTALG